MVSFAVRPTNGAAACNRLVQAAARSSLRGGSASERLFPVQKTGPMLAREQARHRPKVSPVERTRNFFPPCPSPAGEGPTPIPVRPPPSGWDERPIGKERFSTVRSGCAPYL